MTLPAFASIDDFSARLPGGVKDDDSARAQAALDDASTLIREAAGKTWVEDGELVEDLPDILLTICCRAAMRSFVNPTEETQTTAGPFSVSRSTTVYLTDKEREMVRQAATGSAGGAFSIDTLPTCSTIHAEVCALNFGANYCSCGAILAGFPLYEVDVI